jgi:hypothetical protein
MTNTTSNLGLTTYNLPGDNSTTVANYVNQTAGSATTSNLAIIDRFAGETSASMTSSITTATTPLKKTGTAVSIEYQKPIGLNSSGSLALGIVSPLGVTATGSLALGIVTPLGITATGSLTLGVVAPLGITSTGSLALGYVSGCGLTLTSGSLKLETGAGITLSSGSIGLQTSGVASGSYVSVQVDTYGRVTAGSAAETKKKTVSIPLNTSASLAFGEVNYVRIPAEMNSWYLSEAGASCTGSSLTTAVSFNVSQINETSTSAVNMFSTDLVINASKYDSSSGSTTAVISTSASSVWTGHKIKVMTASASTCGSSVTYAQVQLTFQNQ